MTETPELSIYEKAFVKTDDTDGILVVDGKKLHVNKALLSYHSGYFNKLFKSEFEGKSIEEFPVKIVKFEDFATVLSLIHGSPIKYTYDQVESLLKIAGRLQLSAAKRHIELFTLTHPPNKIGCRKQALKRADKFKLYDLLSHVLSLYDHNSTLDLVKERRFLDKLSNEATEKLFERILVFDRIMSQNDVQNMIPPVDIYEKAFAKSDKTDAILVVKGKKLHVNKTVLSHHSDYFNTLFNAEFMEKSIEEIEIKEVNFESFVTLLSLYHSNPIIPTKINAENILELADRFLLPSTKFYMEPCMIHFAFPSIDAIRLGEKYRIDSLYQSGFDRLDVAVFKNLIVQQSYEEFSTDTKRNIFNSYLKFCTKPDYPSPYYASPPNSTTKTPDSSIYKKAFVKTDKTDAILVVDGKKLHINTALLSYHSEYFKTIFNSEFKEKSMEEIPIEDVNFEDFATLLSLIHDAPIEYTYEQLESLLEIADRFLLSAAKRHVELFISARHFSKKDAREHALQWADKFKLNDLMSRVLSSFYSECTYELSKKRDFLDELSNETIAKLFERMLLVDRLLDQEAVNLLQGRRPPVDIYSTSFAKTYETDAILVVNETKLHVNKAVLSYHSDYFKTLFNSEFMEKSMEEIPIEDVNFQSFVTLLSFYHSNPIIPTMLNAESILQLADRFLLPSTKFYMEPYMIHFAFPSIDAIRLGEKYRIDSLYQSGFDLLNKRNRYSTDFNNLLVQPSYQKLSSDTKRKIFNCYLDLRQKPL